MDNNPLLCVKKNDFKKNLEERIVLGTELEKNFQNNDLDAQNNYEQWDSYNKTFLETSFDNPQNKYRVGYSSSGFIYTEVNPRKDIKKKI